MQNGLLVLSHAEVQSLLPMRDCIEVMAEALATLARGDAHNPLRFVVRPPSAAGLMGLMPAYQGGTKAAYGLKAVCVFPGNPARGLDAHQGVVLLFSAETGMPLVAMNASAVTAIRTAAVSGVATRALAREDARQLAVLGSGVQARSHLESMALVREFTGARLWSRTRKHAERLADEVAGRYSFPIEITDSVEDAVRSADVIVTTTSARTPILKREWIAPGAHVNAVGSSISSTRELDTATMAEAALFADRRESLLNESGDYLFAAAEGAISPAHVRAEIGEVLIGSLPGRTSKTELTVFKSLGLAVEDLASAQFVYERARATGTGTMVPFH